MAFMNRGPVGEVRGPHTPPTHHYCPSSSIHLRSSQVRQYEAQLWFHLTLLQPGWMDGHGPCQPTCWSIRGQNAYSPTSDYHIASVANTTANTLQAIYQWIAFQADVYGAEQAADIGDSWTRSIATSFDSSTTFDQFLLGTLKSGAPWAGTGLSAAETAYGKSTYILHRNHVTSPCLSRFSVSSVPAACLIFLEESLRYSLGSHPAKTHFYRR